MRRLIFTLFSGLSLLFCAATIVFWVRSYWVGDHWHHFDPLQGREYSFLTSRGQFSFYRVAFIPASYHGTTVTDRYYRTENPASLQNRVDVLKRDAELNVYGPFLDIAFFRKWPDQSGTYFFEVMVPFWLCFVMSAPWPIFWVRARVRRIRKERLGRNLCVACGYDLRATPDRCPECGVVPSPGSLSPPASLP